ncbi:hypothetical protein Bhyg_08617 [Pseudolycoriella hygida]|uniref:Uncharacterized protein n=1 Tax=Pseudolycoriella hygida TaxID=35572 RepID=A0A9Q0N4Y1_9DIPT|nr:hypothetical protein Bhyg_08617 [Pseudolycoriella hygida]
MTKIAVECQLSIVLNLEWLCIIIIKQKPLEIEGDSRKSNFNFVLIDQQQIPQAIITDDEANSLAILGQAQAAPMISIERAEVAVLKPKVIPYDSDHDAVEYIVNLSNDVMYESPVEHFMYKQADWKKFSNLLNSNLPDDETDLNSNDDIDDYLKIFSQEVLNAMNESIPKKSFSGSNDFPNDVKLLIEYKNKLRRSNHRKGRKLNPLINRLNSLIEVKIGKYRSQMYNRKLKNIRPNGKMYDNIGKLLNKTFQKPPVIKDDGSVISNVKDQANIFTDVFHQIHGQNRHLGDPLFTDHVRETVNTFADTGLETDEYIPTNAEEKNV